MKRTLLALGCVALVLSGMVSANSPATAPTPKRGVAKAGAPALVWNAEISRALLDKYCVICHNARVKTGGFVLEGMPLDNLSANAETWEKVIRKLRAGLMPPAAARHPERREADAFVSWLETSIDTAAAKSPDPGTAVVHRLNRREYRNAIRDLFGLDVDVAEMLPADSIGYGFDNIGDVLSSSPALMERYLISAQKISTSALDIPDRHVAYNTYKFSGIVPQEGGLNDDLPAGARGVSIRHEFPADGEYEIKIDMPGGFRRATGIGGVVSQTTLDFRMDGDRVKLFTVKQEPADRSRRVVGDVVDDPGYTLRLPVKKGIRVISLVFPEYAWMTEGIGPSRLPRSRGAQGQTSEATGRVDPRIESLSINGPFNAEAPQERGISWHRIMVCQPRTEAEEPACAKRIFTALARRAYRRQVSADDVEPFVAAVHTGRAQGGFEAGVRLGIEKLLVDPEFLFRVEQSPAAGRTARVSEIDLASRLSFFLWSSVPDEELLNLAERGVLSAPAVIEQQVRRMLRDEKADSLTRGFFGQWLGYTRVTQMTPDRQIYPWFDGYLAEAFAKETDLFLRAQIQEDRSAIELISARYTYANERLAEHYGLKNVAGSNFRRVELPDDRRSGILGQGSMLTTTSYATRTSPVRRGKWVLETLLGTPPPPPPMNVPALDQSAPTDGKPIPVREQMERHRKNPVCATCHTMIDPLGFALENFDGIGQWRDKEHGVAVDASGNFPDGSKFDGPAAFRGILMQQRESYVTTVTERLLTYALGRGVEYKDMPVVRKIVHDAAGQDYRWSSLVLGIVKSVPFQVKRGES
jgi:mono/diheme cytochrome c family protein